MNIAELRTVLAQVDDHNPRLRMWAVRAMQKLRPGYHVVSVDPRSFLHFHEAWLIEVGLAEELSRDLLGDEAYDRLFPAKPTAPQAVDTVTPAETTAPSKRPTGRPRKPTPSPSPHSKSE